MRSNTFVTIAILVAALCAPAMAQDMQPQYQGQEQPGRRMGVGGQITAIEGSTITLQTFRGDTARVSVTQATQFMKDRQPAKVTDFKVGDMIMVRGEQGKDGTWSAEVVRGRSGGDFARGGMHGQRPNPEDNGKTFIVGEVTKIDGTKLTIRKPDSTEQIIEVDDGTSFRNERRESVTLADFKVGDFVHGQGELKNGVFVPRQLMSGRPRGAVMRMQQNPAPQSQSPQDQSQSVPGSSDQQK